MYARYEEMENVRFDEMEIVRYTERENKRYYWNGKLWRNGWWVTNKLKKEMFKLKESVKESTERQNIYNEKDSREEKE